MHRKSKCDCWCLHFDMIAALIRAVLHSFDNELAGGTKPIRRTSVPYWKEAIGLGSIFCDAKSKKGDKGGGRFINEEPFIDERKPSSTAVEKNYLNNGEHTLLPVTAKMIHFRHLRMQKVCFERRPPASHGRVCWCCKELQ